MTHIAEATTVRAQPSEADLLKYISHLPKSKDGHPVMRLRADLAPGGLGLEHDVEVIFDAPRGEHGSEFSMRVSWRPLGTALLPAFVGLLRLQADEAYGYTWIMIEGDYEPPLGGAGKVFDAIAGERIARGTMRALLDDLRATLESAIHARELGKHKS